MTTLPTVLITGASSGIGATYADRFARRGHPLVLVARNTERLEALAADLRAATDVEVDIITADLTQTADLERVEARLREDDRIGILINNAGIASTGGFIEADAASIEQLIALNITAVTRLAGAVTPRFVARGEGSIVNIGSVVGIAPELTFGIYGGTKAYVLAFSQALQFELGGRGLYVQAVLPAGTQTEIWSRSGREPANLAQMMHVGDLVDASLVGFDAKELVTIPPLPDAAQWEAFEAARKAMLPNLQQQYPAARYRETVPAE